MRLGETKPAFGVKQIRISNVGVIDDLTITLENPSILAICAGNGIGKTTILESVSLLGHLPCFPTLERSQSTIRESVTMRHWPTGEPTDYSYYGAHVDPAELKRIGIEAWMAVNRPKRGNGFGSVEFRLFDTCGAAHYEHKFVVLVHSSRMASCASPRLTDILSRGEFDTYEGGSVSVADDRHLDSCGLILYDRNEQHGGQPLESLIAKLALGRTFHIVKGPGGTPTIEALKATDFPAVEGPRAVVYLNTDLNDFGRGNDLRESPKDLKRDFGAEMISRLRVQFRSDGIFEHLLALRRICASVLKTPLEHYSAQNVLPADFYLANIQKSGPGAEVSIDRLDHTDPVDVNFLSAGENEVFFVSLVAINSVSNPALGPTILLLDEPDLHIANVARSEFFSEVLSIVDGRAQLILSTHSAALFNVLRRRCRLVEDKVQVVYRAIEDASAPVLRMVSKFDPIFLGRMRNVDRDGKILAAAWDRFTAYFRLQVARTEASLPGENSFATAVLLVSLVMASLLVLVALGIAALSVDSAVGQSSATFGYHRLIVNTLGGDLFFLIASTAVLLIFRRRADKRRARLVEQVKRPLKELQRPSNARDEKP